MIRIAAVGDVHVDKDVVGRYRPALEELPNRADALLIAGDLTRHGTPEEANLVYQACKEMKDKACTDDIKAKYPNR